MPFYFILQLGFSGQILKDKTIQISRNYMRVNQSGGADGDVYPAFEVQTIYPGILKTIN